MWEFSFSRAQLQTNTRYMALLRSASRLRFGAINMPLLRSEDDFASGSKADRTIAINLAASARTTPRTTDTKHQIFDTLRGFRKTMLNLLFKVEFGSASGQCNRTGRTKQEQNGSATVHNRDSWFPNGDHDVVGCFRGDHPTSKSYASPQVCSGFLSPHLAVAINARRIQPSRQTAR